MANYRKVARRKARKYGLKPRVFVRQIKKESNFNPRARSPMGAAGIAQIMPETAEAWDVDPMKPRQALDAAAKNMASYVRKYGSYENALRAYNAGPGAIEASKSYPETNDYVKFILRGRDPKDLDSPSRGPEGAPNRNQAEFRIKTIAGQDRSGDRRALLANYLLSSQKYEDGGLLELKAGLDEAQDIPDSFERVRVPGSRDRNSPARRQFARRNGGGKPPGRLLEMFHDPGINIDEGKRTGAIGGHGTHVHVAIDNPAGLRRARKIAESMGLVITSTTGGKHAPGSYHYAGKAIDVGGDPAKLKKFNRRIARLYS